MSQCRLAAYFQEKSLAMKALRAYADFAREVSWPISDKFRLYRCAKTAFDSPLTESRED